MIKCLYQKEVFTPMEIFDFDYKNVPSIQENFILCLGYFDGVHIGHQNLIKEAMNEGYKVALLTFDNSPLSITHNLTVYQSLTSIADKAEFMEKMGLDYFLLMHFDLEVSKLTKDQLSEITILILNKLGYKIN